jgi:hypothetical protein
VTEVEWLACTDPRMMLEYLRGKDSRRKLRLFACGCCRLVWDRMKDPRSRNAIEVIERNADGEASGSERAAAWTAARPAARTWAGVAARSAARKVSWKAAQGASWYVMESLPTQAALMRDVFGNPFRPVTVSPAWQTPQVVALAQPVFTARCNGEYVESGPDYKALLELLLAEHDPSVHEDIAVWQKGQLRAVLLFNPGNRPLLLEITRNAKGELV